jgi:hypothetical protein
LIRVNIVGVIE